MSFTPAHLQTISNNDLFETWKQDVIQVKRLHLEKKYKRCAALCTNLQSSAKHPIHKAFLFFYQAICYELLGVAAHVYSENKRSLLQLAQESYRSALQTLPQPYASNQNGQPYTPRSSPMCATLGILQQYQTPSLLFEDDSPCPADRGMQRGRSLTESSTYSSISQQAPPTITVPDLENHSPCQNLVTKYESPSSILTPPSTQSAKRRSKSKARLSESLSSTRTLAEDLIPSPLLLKSSRNPTTIKLEPGSEQQEENLPDETLKPLPPLPFNHNPTFRLKGTRQILIPTRKSAIQTLIAKFENTLSPTPSDYSPSYSPLTPRFDRISHAFSPIPLNSHLDTYLTSVSLARYNDHLSSFRAQLNHHLLSIDMRIEDLERLVDDRVNGGDDGGDNGRQSRLEKLKASGWRVRKERYGWKGQEYYDDLCRRVELDFSLDD